MKKKVKQKKTVVLGDTNCWPFVLQESIIWQGRNEVHANHFHRRCTTEGAAETDFGVWWHIYFLNSVLAYFFLYGSLVYFCCSYEKGTPKKKKKKNESTNHPSSSPSWVYFSGSCTVTSLHLPLSGRYQITICWWIKVACILIYETPSHPLT